MSQEHNVEETFEHRFVFEKPDVSYPYEILMRVNHDQTRSIATPQDIAKLIDDVAERVEKSLHHSHKEELEQARREECRFCKDKGVIELIEEERAEIKNKFEQLINGMPGRLFLLPPNVEKVVGYIKEDGIGDVAYKGEEINLMVVINEAFTPST